MAEKREVPVSESRALLEQLRAAGGNAVRHAELPGLGRELSDTAFLDDAVSTCLFAQRRGK